MSYIPPIFCIVDTNNTTNSVVTDVTPFTGTSTDVSLYSSVTISVNSSSISNTTLSVEFSPNGTNWDFTQNFLLSTNQKTVTFPVIYRFFRVRFSISSGSTTIRLQSILNVSQTLSTRSVVDSIQSTSSVESLTPVQSTNTFINGITSETDTGPLFVDPLTSDNTNNLNVSLRNPSSSLNDIRTIFPTTASQIDFVYGTGALINTNTSAQSTGGSGTALVSNSVLTLSTNTTSGSFMTLLSKKYLKYKRGQGGLTRFSVSFGSTFSGTNQFSGCGTDTDGLFFGYSGTTFGIFRRIDSTDTFIPQSSWNGDTMTGDNATSKSAYTLNPQVGNIYQIVYDGDFGNAYFYVMNTSITVGEFILVHTLYFSNLNTTPLLRNPSFPLYFKVENLATTNNTTLSLLAGSQFCDGKEKLLGPTYSISRSGVTSTVTPIETAVLAVRNRTDINGVTNRGVIKLTGISIGTNTTDSLVSVTICKGDIINPLSFANTDTVNSISEFTITPSGVGTVKSLHCITCGSGSTSNSDLTPFNLFFYPGETAVILRTTIISISSLINFSLSWTEDI